MKANFYSRCLNIIRHFQTHREILIVKGNAVHEDFIFRYDEFISAEIVALLETVALSYLRSESYHDFVKSVSKQLTVAEIVLLTTRILPLCVECGRKFYGWTDDSQIAMAEARELLITASMDASNIQDKQRATFSTTLFKKVLNEVKTSNKSLTEICKKLHGANAKSLENSFRIWFRNEFGYTFSLKKLRGI